MSSTECETSKARHNSYRNTDIRCPFGKEFNLVRFTLLSLYRKMPVLMRETGYMVLDVLVGRSLFQPQQCEV